MPYIKQPVRNCIDPIIDKLVDAVVQYGDLNYAITTLCDKFLNAPGTNYSRLNSIIGVLECAKLEFYRRVVATYEDTKLKENGDVYNV